MKLMHKIVGLMTIMALTVFAAWYTDASALWMTSGYLLAGAAFQWVPDMPSGVLRNRALSKELRYASIPETKFLQHIAPVDGYGRHMGDTVTIARVRNISEPTSGIIGRNQKVPVDTLAMSATTITVSKYGRAVEYDEETELLSYFNPKDFIQKSLIKAMKLTLDTAGAVPFKGCQVKYAPTSAITATITTNATPATATYNYNVYHAKQVRDYLAATIHTEPAEGDDWLALAATKALRGIKDDPEFVDWRRYIQPEMAFYRGEAGMIEHIRHIEVTHTNALSGTKGTGSVLGEVVIFGEEPVLMAEVLTPELRAAIPGNFGLQRAVAWYGLLAFGEVWNTANDGEARIVHVTSA
jgi:N4-gp56 family major capsid protein